MRQAFSPSSLSFAVETSETQNLCSISRTFNNTTGGLSTVVDGFSLDTNTTGGGNSSSPGKGDRSALAEREFFEKTLVVWSEIC
jgi:hypothetical protein